MEPGRELSRRGIFATTLASLTVMVLGGFPLNTCEAAAGKPVIQGATNDSGTSETMLRSTVPGNKATLAIMNDILGTPGNPPPDGLRVFTTGSGGGVALQAFGGPGTFSVAPRGGIGIRAIGTLTGIMGKALGGGTTGNFEQGTGVYGQGRVGVFGEYTGPGQNGAGVLGRGPTGVRGQAMTANDIGVAGFGATQVQGQGTGVLGNAVVGTGVKGRGWHGVHGADASGVQGSAGVLATVEPNTGPNATAFEAQGPVKFSSAGLATIAANTSSVIVTPQQMIIGPNTKVLCTLQSTGGLLLNVIRNANNTFTINLTANATAPVTVAWFVIS